MSKILDEGKIERFLESSGFDDYLWVVSLTCEKCKMICKAIKLGEKMLFECPNCHYRWELIDKPIGFIEGVN